MPITRRIAALSIPLLIYATAAFLLFGRGGDWLHDDLGVSADPLSFIWFLHWWPFAISHGLNPFVTSYVWFPHGYNLTWATSIPLAALVMAPVTMLLGPALSFNLLTIAAPVLAGWTAFLLCEDITDDWPASLFGGYLYGFSAYEVGQILGHLNLDFTCLVPLILLLCIRRVRGAISRRAFIIALTACLLAEFGLSTEILATLCVFGAMAWAVFLLCTRPEERPVMWRTAFEIATAALIAIILASPFLYYMVQGRAEVPPQINIAQDYVTDPRNFLIPTALMRLNTPYFQRIAGQFDGNGSEQGAYLGLPLLLLLGLFFTTRIRRPHVLPLLLVTLILAVFSLGPHLQTGLVPTHIPLPWLLTRHLPLLGQLLPSRFSMYIALATCMAAALALAAARGWRRWLSYGLALAACVSLLPIPNIPPWSPLPASPFLTAANITATLGKMPNVLILPFGDAGPAMGWQLDAQMSFRQTGGYAGFIPAPERQYPAFADLTAGLPTTTAINALEDLCVSHAVQYILLAPNTPPALSAAILALGWPVRQEPGVTIVTVPAASHLAYYTLTGDYWDSPAPHNWIGRSITIVTHNTPLHVTLLGAWTRPSPTTRLTVTIEHQTAVYPVTPSTIIPLDIPPNATVTITANETWVPDKLRDPRHLSVILDLGGN